MPAVLPTPAVLIDQQVHQATVPLTWQPVLEAMRDFTLAERALRGKSASAAEVDSLISLHQRVVAMSASLLEPHAIDDVSEVDLASVFARSVFLLIKIGQCVANEPPPLDTSGSRTLRLYEADYFAAPDHCRQLCQSLVGISPLSAETLTAIEQRVARDAQSASETANLVAAIRGEFDLHLSNENLDEAIFRWFATLHPDSGLVVGEVQIVVTSQMIFFCIALRDHELTSPRFASLPEDERAKIRRFLEQSKRFAQSQFAHFPVFGHVRGEDCDVTVRQRLADRSGLALDLVTQKLTRLTAIVPQSAIDQYLIHDLWGHGWQASLLGFDQLYETLATYAEPLTLQTPCDAAADAPTLADCFTQQDSALSLNRETFGDYVDRMIAARLPVALTPVIAELLADVTEFKIADPLDAPEPGQASILPTSSRLATFPAKLDLLVQDLEFYGRHATKAFRLLESQPKRRAQVVQALMDRGVSPERATAVIEEAVAIWRDLAADRYSDDPSWSRDGNKLRVNLAARVTLNFLGIHRETLRAYDRLRGLDPGDLPIKGFRDLLLIAAAVFFEQSPAENLWRVDEFLSLKISPLCDQWVRGAAVGG